MINRRRALRSFLSLAAAGTASRSRMLFGSWPVSGVSAASESPLTLAEMLGEAIELCRAMKVSPLESRRLCEIALVRLQRSVDSSPAFWQACSDSIARLETAVSGYQNADSLQEPATTAVLYRLRSLRRHLVNQVIGGLGRLA